MLRARGEPRPLIWRATSKTDFAAFPPATQREMGYALFLAQLGERHAIMAKTLKGFGGTTVVEVKQSYGGNAYRAVYTLRGGGLCASRLPKEIEDWRQDAETGPQAD